ncbi:TPA: lysozyme inhibitor LprI family protein [Escherichia coli]
MKNIIAAIVLSATAFGADAASFDCTKATTKSEKFICANESISALDSKLHEVYVKAVKIDPSLKQEQRNWNKTVRDTMINIGQIQPLEAVYNAQIQNLMNVLSKEETASESDSETSAKVEEEQPKQEEVKKLNVTAIYACTTKFTWKVIDGEETEAVKDKLYGNKTFDNNGGKLKIKMVDDVPVSFVYSDKYDVYKSSLKPSKENPNAMEGKSKQDTIGRVNTYNIWISKKGDMRLEVIEPKFDSEYKHTQFACDMVDAE